ncbi:hypothetical protein [Thermostaphylospora chromogena]|uniref:Uncharacterized protein n=1 Tax=Thermostaphylospora chromogena TaxID=35622 RepID=A0A1H1DTR5_9ACTN|nr:hypothetical protein [Thermostaphylospora chromogena]SDQ79911.1 hypothetical protein SAMN04489764_2168 [Thermostaphylospora chromogena]
MSKTEADHREEPPAPATGRRRSIDEDWAATILGLVLLVLVIAGVIPTGLVP